MSSSDSGSAPAPEKGKPMVAGQAPPCEWCDSGEWMPPVWKWTGQPKYQGWWHAHPIRPAERRCNRMRTAPPPGVPTAPPSGMAGVMGGAPEKEKPETCSHTREQHLRMTQGLMAGACDVVPGGAPEKEPEPPEQCFCCEQKCRLLCRCYSKPRGQSAGGPERARGCLAHKDLPASMCPACSTVIEDAARFTLGPWAERPVESTPQTRAELVRNVAEALRGAAPSAPEGQKPRISIWASGNMLNLAVDGKFAYGLYVAGPDHSGEEHAARFAEAARAALEGR